MIAGFLMEEHMRKIITFAVAALVAAPAAAQDATNFNGFFIGGQTGWEQDKAKIKDENISHSRDGWIYGAQAGYDWRLSDWSVGLEAMISGSSGTNELIDSANNSYKLNAGTTWGFSGRAGYVVSDATLLYGRVGYSWASYNLVFNNSIKDSVHRDGITVGVGAEYQFAQNVSARLEWNYADFGSEEFQRPPAGGSIFLPTKINYERMGVALGLNFRF
jgi:outer membrane immunogenic protein